MERVISQPLQRNTTNRAFMQCQEQTIVPYEQLKDAIGAI